MFNYLFYFVSITSLLIPTLHAKNLDSDQSSFTSSTAFGFSVENDIKFSKKTLSGSMVDFSIVKPVRYLNVGIKTLAVGGGHGNNERFYRLSSGLMAQTRLFTWAKIETMVGYFSQTYTHPTIGDITSKGLQMAVGWLQTIDLSPNAELGWGAFHSFQEGESLSPLDQNGSDHASQSHALKINLAVRL